MGHTPSWLYGGPRGQAMGHLSLPALGSRLMAWPAWLWGFGKEQWLLMSNSIWQLLKIQGYCALCLESIGSTFSFCHVCLFACFWEQLKEQGKKQRHVTLHQEKQLIGKNTQYIGQLAASTQGQISKQFDFSRLNRAQIPWWHNLGEENYFKSLQGKVTRMKIK